MKDKRLLGDQVERILHKVGVDKVVKIIEKKTGKDCGCKKRKQKLNDYHKRMQKMRDRIIEEQLKKLKR